MKQATKVRLLEAAAWAVLLLGFWLMQGGGYVPGFGPVLP